MGIETIAAVGLVASIVGTGASIAEGRKVEGNKRRQNKKVQASNAAKAATAKRQTLREERVRRAQLAAQAEAGGFGESSTAISGEALSGTIASQKTGEVSSALSSTNAISSGAQSIADSQSRQQLFSNVSKIGSSVFQSAGGFGAVEGLFDGSAAAGGASNTTILKNAPAINTPTGGR